MELKQLAEVLGYIVRAVDDHGLPELYRALIESLQKVVAGTDSAESVHRNRLALISVLRSAEPHWGNEHHALFVSYDAALLLGHQSAEQINTLFVEHFMDPDGLSVAIQHLHDETVALRERAFQLFEGISPIMEHLPTVMADNTVVGDVIDSEPRHWLAVVKNKLVPQNHWPTVGLAPKLLTALPIAIAAASKAVDLYRTHQAQKQPPAVPAKKVVDATPSASPSIQSIQYSYRQSIYIFPSSDEDSSLF